MNTTSILASVMPVCLIPARFLAVFLPWVVPDGVGGFAHFNAAINAAPDNFRFMLLFAGKNEIC